MKADKLPGGFAFGKVKVYAQRLLSGQAIPTRINRAINNQMKRCQAMLGTKKRK